MKLYDVGDAGRTWIRQRLDETGGTLLGGGYWTAVASALHRTLQDSDEAGQWLERGSVGTLVRYPWLGGLQDLETGGRADVAEAGETVARWIREFVQTDDAHFCLIDEPSLEPGMPHWDEIIASFGNAVLYCDDHAIYRVARENSGECYVAELVSLAYGSSFCCALFRGDASALRNAEPGSRVSLEALTEAAVGLAGVAVDAYNGESVAIWTPAAALPDAGNPWL